MKITFAEGEFNFQKDYGLYVFYLGLFLLPSALPFSLILLLFVSIRNLVIFRKNLLNQNINILFIFSGLLITFSAILNYLDINLHHQYALPNNNISSLIGLFNWLPLFILFIGCQPYLSKSFYRKNCALILLAGSFPVLLIGILQAFFSFYGPFESFYGLLVWYSRPIDSYTDITSIFNNPNYFGSWLNLIWPFCLALTLNSENNNLKKLFIFYFLFLTPLCIVLTSSRVAWFGLFFSSFLFYGKKGFKYLLPLLLVTIFIGLNIVFPVFGLEFQNFLRSFFPEGLWINLIPSHYENIPLQRIEIWNYAINMVLERPLLGYGSSTFSQLLFNQTDFWRGHAHNFPLELLVSFGIPTALTIILPILTISLISFQRIFYNHNKKYINNNFEKAWVISLMFLIINHLFDVLYFDGRISIASWILLGGTSQMILKDKGKLEE